MLLNAHSAKDINKYNPFFILKLQICTEYTWNNNCQTLLLCIWKWSVYKHFKSSTNVIHDCQAAMKLLPLYTIHTIINLTVYCVIRPPILSLPMRVSCRCYCNSLWCFLYKKRIIHSNHPVDCHILCWYANVIHNITQKNSGLFWISLDSSANISAHKMALCSILWNHYCKLTFCGYNY